MALIIADRVVESSTTTGTGAFSLAGAVTGYRRFSAVCSTSDTLYYCIEAIDANGNPSGDWETGLGTYSSANTLTRTSVSASSNANAAVNFAAGSKRVSLNATAAHIAALQPLDSDLTALAGLAGVRGDIIYRDAAQWQRLAAGTSGQFLKTLGSGADPAWANPHRTLVTETAADSSTTTFSFTSISNSFAGLEIDCNFTVATNSLIIRANNDSSGVAGTSGKYQMQRTGHSNGAINLQQVLQTGWNVSTSLATGVAVDFRMRLLNYALSAKKLAQFDAVWGTSGSGNLAIDIAALLWDDTTAISRLDFIFGAAPTGGKIRLFGLS